MKRFVELRTLYEKTTDPDEIAALQLARFNAHWHNAWQNVPFYQKWRQIHKLPPQINDLNELSEFPILTKQDVSDARDLVDQTPGTDRNCVTGGTSGMTTTFPMGNVDANSAWINTHLGRKWNGIDPVDPLFLIWGHGHLFAGKGRRLKKFKRDLKDRLNNIKRVSAYNLDNARLEDIANKLERFAPRYVIGYGSCLTHLCGFLKAQDRTLRDVGVTRIVNTSETLSEVDAARISKMFGCPVINEYGMAEAGVIAYSCGNLHPLRIFWNSYIARTVDRSLLITTIGSRCFPLINYDTEDLCDDETPLSGSHLFLSNLSGKVRDVFELTDRHGKRHTVPTYLFDSIMKWEESLKSIHYEICENGVIRILYTVDNERPDPEQLMQRLEQKLRLDGIEIDRTKIDFSLLDKPLQTVAGKRVTIVRHN